MLCLLPSPTFYGATSAGEIFGGLPIPDGESDSFHLLKALSREDSDIPSILSQIKGPSALCFWQAHTETLWMAKDPAGNSLCIDRKRLPCLGI